MYPMVLEYFWKNEEDKNAQYLPLLHTTYTPQEV